MRGSESKGMWRHQQRERSNERANKRERKREKESRTNDGIVTRLWMGASMKPMVCKTPRESTRERDGKGNRGNAFEVARASIASKGERSAKGENREAASVVINEFRAGENVA